MTGFATPLALLLLPLPLLAARLLPPARGASAALVVPETVAAGFAEARGSGLAAAGRRLVPWLLWAALVVALAGPRAVLPAPALPASGRDILLTLDLSGSMDRRDFLLDGRQVRRLDAVKAVAADFVRGRGGDRVGLVIFAEQAYVAAPPTHDLAAVVRAIEGAEIGIAGRSTAISDGLGLALKRLEPSTAASRVVILMSDGVNNAGTVKPMEAAGLARELGIRVHTIALGPRDLGEGDGDPDVVDAGTLRQVAEASGGEAFRVKTTQDLKAVGAAIDRLETSRTAAPVAEVHRDLWPWPAGLALALALLLMIDRRRA
ncbi:VWA domain-containing protein [Prosthecomicrobium sp. N25]|uniref:VWA domain-containing protein n=1 Tax=Prosthecomicrobium sp. N25 TaxID=3129254 RepID=UPI003077C400